MRDYAGFFKLCEIAYFMCYKVNYANIMPDHNPGHSSCYMSRAGYMITW